MSDDHSARLGLPYLAAGQMQKHVTLNEALTRLDIALARFIVRLAAAHELALADRYDDVVVNDDLDRATDELVRVLDMHERI